MRRDDATTARAFVLAFVLTGALAGCAGYGTDTLRVGQAEAQVIASMGTPTHRYPLPAAGQRLEFARGPIGKHTFMVDLNAAGQVTVWRQVLTDAEFAAITPGMYRDEVLRRIGAPGEVQQIAYHLHRWMWMYRWDDPMCSLFVVVIDDAGQVTEIAHRPDPVCSIDLSPP
jgi:outer membrane protein assembly factor BamE (lipoprotein component of BamABCDE complex)